ncbi:MAG: flippase [Anaplasmataceae bacterium]|nr:flippase [Anaplasmataceae bacterium]
MLERLKLLLFTNRGIRQTVTKNSFWLSVSNFGGRFIRAIIVVYAARVLGAEEWGVFSYALTVAALLTIFVDFGVGPLLTRESARLAQDATRRKQIVSTSFYIRLVLLFFSALLVLFVTPYITTIEAAVALLPIMAIIMVLDSFRDFFLSIARALEKMEWEAYISLFTNAAVVVASIILLQYSFSAEYLAYGYTLGITLGTIATIYLLRQELRGLFSNFDFRYVRLILTAAVPYAVSAILAGLMISTDIIILGYFRSAEEVGLYSAVVRIIQMIYIIPGILAVSAFPLFSRLAFKEDIKLRTILERIIATMFLIALPLALGGALVAGPLTELLFGGEYLPATPAFQILLLTLLVNFPMVILSNFVFAYNRQRALVIFSIIGAVGNVVFDLLLIPGLGIIGSAWATLGSQVLCNAYLWWITKKINNFSVWTYLPKILGASAVMSLTVVLGIFMQWPVMVIVILGGAVYALTLLLLKDPLFVELRETLKLI